MFNNKKGLSTIVITIMLVAFVIIAVGLVWTVVRGLISSKTSEINLNVKCSGVSLIASKVICIPGIVSAKDYCNVTLKRVGNEKIPLDNIQVNFIGTNGNSLPDPVLFGSLNEGQTATKQFFGLTNVWPVAYVEAIPYFKDSSGNDFFCPRVTKEITA